jgi:hypothetical protein
MTQKPQRRWAYRICTAILLGGPASIALWFALPVAAQSNSQPAPQNLPAEKVFKNIQVFQGLPSSQLIENMFYMEGSLGVSCNECHVNFEDFEKDDNPKKQTARRMITLVRALNKDHFDGRSTITCNTCHRGRAVPLAPLAFAAIKNSKTSRAPAPAAAPSLTVDQIFERYIAATHANSPGESAAMDVLSGSMLSSEGWVAPLKIFLSGPDKFLATFDIGWFSYNAFNGEIGWGQDNQGLHDAKGKNLALLKREAALFHPSILKQQYSSLKLAGTEMIDDHQAYVVEGSLPGSDNEKLYFDLESGLLVRIQSATETSLGMLPHQTNLRDYRDVGGVKLPFEVDQFASDFSSVYKITEAKHGAPLQSGLFDKPREPWKGFPK